MHYVKGLKVVERTYHMYVASRGRLLYIPGVELVVEQFIKLPFFVWNFFFAICQLRHAHMRKDTRISPLFCTAATKSWVGPGSKAK